MKTPAQIELRLDLPGLPVEGDLGRALADTVIGLQDS